MYMNHEQNYYAMKITVKLILTSLVILVLSRLQAQNYDEVIKAVASDRAAHDYFGYNVSISGNYAIIGAYAEDEDASGLNTLQVAGSAYIFESDGAGNWSEVQKLVASDRAANDRFGISVSISGDYAIIGATGADSNTGSAYVFERDGGGTWTEVQKLEAFDKGLGDYYGVVSISGNYAIIGAQSEDQDGNNLNTLAEAGSAYVYERDEFGYWDEVIKLIPSDRGAGDRFGTSVSVSGDNIIIGARLEDEDADGLNTASNAGSAYVFERDAFGNWNEVQKLVASDRGASDQFGYSVSISGNYAIIGAFYEDEDANGQNTISSAGSAYLFENDGAGTWAEVQKLVASDRGGSDLFGLSVSISGNYAIVGAYQEDEDADGLNTTSNAGSAYVYKRAGSGNWAEVQKLVASDRDVDDQFGLSVSISDNYAIVGANREDEDADGLNTASDAGSVYILEAPNPPVFTSSTSAEVTENISTADVVLDFQANDGDGGALDANLTYALSGTDAGDFTLDADDGELRFAVSPDFENPSDDAGINEYHITVTADDTDGSSEIQDIIITVTNLDDTAPVFTSGTSLSVFENFTISQVIYTATATDEGTVTYSLGGTNQASFGLGVNSGELTFNESPDFETKSSYGVTITATDNLNYSTDLALTITINDLDENSPVFTSGTSASIDENSAISTVVYTATATDEGTVTYSLGGTDQASFGLGVNSGELTFNEYPDFETKSSYGVTITATDNLNYSTDLALTITINDLDENSPVFTSGTSASIDENSAISTVVYTATATDEGTVAFSLAGTDGSSFSIDASTGAMTFVSSPDFETQSSYAVSVMATDDSGNEADLSLTVIINDIVVIGDINGDETINDGEIAGDIDLDGQIGTGEVAGDTNGDGVIGTGEVEGDVNGDGVINNGEIEGDTNGDGQLSASEGSPLGVGRLDRILIYPNPAAKFLVIETDEPVSLNFFHLNGQLAKSLDNVRGQIRLSDLKTGWYLMEIVSGNERFVRKILKTN